MGLTPMVHDSLWICYSLTLERRAALPLVIIFLLTLWYERQFLSFLIFTKVHIFKFPIINTSIVITENMLGTVIVAKCTLNWVFSA